MLSIPSAVRIYLAAEPTDIRPLDALGGIKPAAPKADKEVGSFGD